MKYSFLQLIDLPDELLLMIFKNLKNVFVLYSFIGINRRLDQLLQDSIFTNRLTLMTCSTNGDFYPICHKTIDRFYYYILPQIHHKVQWLNLEASSMERFLLAISYPNLYGLGLYNVKQEIIEHHFTDKSSLSHIFKNQISILVIKLDTNQRYKDIVKRNIFTSVLRIFTNLHYLNFDPFFDTNIEPLSFDLKLTQTFSSLFLKELHINVRVIDDCLYLLNGCLNQLEKLFVNIEKIDFYWSTINRKGTIDNLKCFSLISRVATRNYNDIIVPLLHRMSNLESLGLYLMMSDSFGRERFLDGSDLKKDIVDHLPRLNKFTFNIHSRVFNPIHLPSNEDIQNTFTNFKDNRVISYIDYFPEKKIGECHIYSSPYTMKFYKNITNNFRGGLFKYVRDIFLFDERPFEHQFFIQIAQSFPFIKKLSLTNMKPQQHKQSQRSTNENNQENFIIKYPYLTEINLFSVHEDYIEQFLDHTKTCLPENIQFRAAYELLERVTHHFTRETTRINCAKITNLSFPHAFRTTEQFRIYFPLVNR